jgi:hypothetical protein
MIFLLFKRALGRSGPVLALALLVAGVSMSFADTWKGLELEALWRKAPWHFGPLRIQPSLVLSNAGVDSNIYYSGNPIKDYTLTAGPAVTVYLPIYRKLILSGTASPQYVHYFKTKQERTWNYYLTGSAALNLKSVFLSFDINYSDAREHWNTEIDIRPRRKEDGLGGSFLVQTSRRTSLSLSYREAKYDYESLVFDIFNVREQLNRKEQYFDLSAYYQVTSRTKFFLDLEYGVYKFAFADTAALKDSQSRAAYGGFEFSPTGRIRGKVRVGYKIFDIKNPEETDYRGLVGDAQVSVRLARPFVVRASYKRDVDFSLWYSNPYYLENTIRPGASFYVLKFVRLDYDYSLGRNRYPEVQPIGGGTNVKRLDDYRIHSAGIYFRIKKKVALGVIGSRWARISNLVSENNKRYFYGLNLTYDF